MNATTTNTDTSTQPQDNAAFPRTPEALHQAGAELQLPLTLHHRAMGLTAYMPPLAARAKTIVVELRLTTKLPGAFVASFTTLPAAIDYMLAAGFEVCDPPAGRVRISDFRDAVDRLNYTRADLAGATLTEFARMDVRGRITNAIAAVARLRPGVPPRFVRDLRDAEMCIERAQQVIGRWVAARGEDAPHPAVVGAQKEAG